MAEVVTIDSIACVFSEMYRHLNTHRKSHKTSILILFRESSTYIDNAQRRNLILVVA
jgi:hypothetical protein